MEVTTGVDSVITGGRYGISAINDGSGAPAVTGWKFCRHHGAGGGAPKGKRNGNYKTGHYTREAIALRKDISALLRQSRHLIEELDQS